MKEAIEVSKLMEEIVKRKRQLLVQMKVKQKVKVLETKRKKN